MPDKVKLSEAELAALDVIIHAKRQDAQLFNELAFLPRTTPAILAATRLLTRITPTITRWTAITLDVIGPIIKEGPDVLKQIKQASSGKGLSVDDLVNIRRDAGGGGAKQ